MEPPGSLRSKYLLLRTIIIYKMRFTTIISRHENASVKCATAALCAIVLLVQAQAAGAATHEYVVTVDADMRRMHVEARFGAPVERVSARMDDAGDFLSDVGTCKKGERIRIRNKRMLLPNEGISCLHYSVDLRGAAAIERRNAALSDTNIIVSPATWFWRPKLDGNDKINVRFETPDSVRVSVPWNIVAGTADTYQLQNSPESSTAFAAFGQFQFFETEIPGATLRITLMQPENEVEFEPIIKWVSDTAQSINLAYGKFPNPDTNVVVLPSRNRPWGGDSAVSFGRVVRDGGETVELFINPARPIAEFYDDWTATHEFSHLMLPYISGRHRWVSEGFATYYQNLLMARAGHYTEPRAWQKLWEGFERGRSSRPEMTINDAADGGVRGATMKIYWSGAAIALLADVELRQRSNGTESLDTVLGRLAACCLPSERAWSGPELFRKLDSLIDEPVFMPIYSRYANSAGFPEVRPLLEQLGVEFSGSRIRLHDNAELADLRRSIISTRQ
jgi:hypothetical protein